MPKTTLITGATGGIGWETALLFAEKGYRIVAIGRNREKLNELQNALPGADHLFLTCDLSDISAITPLMATIAHECDTIDVLVNNAGQGLFKALQETTSAEESALLNLNLLAPMELTRCVLPIMKKQGGGAIVNVSSVAGKRAFKKLTAYCASKFGLIGFSNSLRRELKHADAAISVSVICPPATRTDFFKNADYPNFKADHPSLTLVHPRIVAQAIWGAVQQKKREIIITPRAKILDKLAAIFPAFIEWLEEKVS